MTTPYLPSRYSLRSLLLGLAGGLIHGTVFGAALAGLTYLLLDVALGAAPGLSVSAAVLVGLVGALAVLSVQLMAAREAAGNVDVYALNPADGSFNVDAGNHQAALGIPGSGLGVGR